MPLNSKYQAIMDDMMKRYGSKKGKTIFYKTMNKRHVTEEEMTGHHKKMMG